MNIVGKLIFAAIGIFAVSEIAKGKPKKNIDVEVETEPVKQVVSNSVFPLKLGSKGTQAKQLQKYLKNIGLIAKIKPIENWLYR